MRRTRESAVRAFTLMELILALVIGAACAAATAMVISNATGTRDGIRGRAQAFGRAASAADLIAGDAMNLVRDTDLYFARVVLKSGEGVLDGEEVERDDLMMVSRVTRPSRVLSEQAEGDEAEVQWRVVEEEISAGVRGKEALDGRIGASLWRRVDTGPDDVPEGGGVAGPTVEGVVGLAVQVSDTEGVWYDEWDSDYDGLPMLIRITATARDSTGEYQRVARRTIAVDRTGSPGASVVDSEEEEEPSGNQNNAGDSTTGTSGSTGAGSEGGSGSSGSGSGGGGNRPGGNPRPGGGAGGGPGGGGNPGQNPGGNPGSNPGGGPGPGPVGPSQPTPRNGGGSGGGPR